MEKTYTCRICGKQFTAREEDMGKTWYMRSQGYSYHLDCWNRYANIHLDKDDGDWLDLIFFMITHELHLNYDYFKIKAQCEKMKKDGKTMKGIYFTCYYYFIINKREYKPEYGLGIVPYIYEEATRYWYERQLKEEDILKEIVLLQTINAGEGIKMSGKKRTKKREVTAEPIL